MFHLTEGVAEHLLTSWINLARLLLHPEGMAPRIASLDEWAWHVLNGLHRQADRTHPRLTAMIYELHRSCPIDRVTRPDHLGFAVPRRGGDPRCLLTWPGVL